MDLRMFLIPYFLAFLVPAWPVLTKPADVCVKETTITEKDTASFESVRKQYEEALGSRLDLRDLVQKVQPEELIPYELGQYYNDVCPSENRTAIFWGIPYQAGYRCWNIQPVTFIRCRIDTCQNWNGVSWIQGYRFLCKEKYVYEHVWSFCAKGKQERFFVFIKVKIPKCCACTLAQC